MPTSPLFFAQPARLPNVRPLFGADSPAPRNQHGDLAGIDFAVSEPLRCLSDEALGTIRGIVEAHRGKAFTNARSTSLRGVEELQQLFASPSLEDLLSTIAGARLRIHPMGLEHAHVNLQSRRDAPVDDWHIDYVPFVCVFMIACDDGQGGALRTRHHGAYTLRPGEAVLLQGSHVEHRADAATNGERITLVTSLVPADPWYRDVTRVRRGALPYSPDEPLADQAATYRRTRIHERAQQIADGSAWTRGRFADELDALSFERERWAEAALLPHDPAAPLRPASARNNRCNAP